jgi:ribulose 1,5-bisphosphate synthetase/thiazole synthase
MLLRKTIVLMSAVMFAEFTSAQQTITTDVLVIGGGTGGTAAGIQCARMGVPTIIAEEGAWLGGMLSSAGVSATDGNHNLPSGIWNEFRNEIYKVYSGANKVATGWISNTHFEPHVADSIFKAMAAKEKQLTVLYHHQFITVIKKENQITGAVFINTKTKKKITVYAKQVIEATELGDVIAAAKIPFSLGMESSTETGEDVGVKETNDFIQDLTWVAILKDFGTGADKTIPKPANYDPKEFDACCTDFYNDKTRIPPTVDAKKMIDYAKLPNGKYMINWPGHGNDIYLNIIPLTPKQRIVELQKAKQQTLRFVYFIQTQLGFKHLGLATDEFATKDKLAYMPYYRESRRVKGITRFLVNHISQPFNYHYYRTGISVGDYPIDHHHRKNEKAPKHLGFYPVPSYNIPLGSLIPQAINGLIVCDKTISVSNVVNGTTRLQPVVMLTGQAAGTLAALCIRNKQQAREIGVRQMQDELLKYNMLIMPYRDAGINHPHCKAIQRIGATGILKGKGIPYQWANQTWFYPDSLVNTLAFIKGFEPFASLNLPATEFVTVGDAMGIIQLFNKISGENLSELVKKNWQEWGLTNFNTERNITRAELSVLLDNMISPFHFKQVDHKGDFIQ